MTNQYHKNNKTTLGKSEKRRSIKSKDIASQSFTKMTANVTGKRYYYYANFDMARSSHHYDSSMK